MILKIILSLIFLSKGEPVNGIENRLDHCTVTVSPELNPDHESVEVPDDLLRSLQIIGKVIKTMYLCIHVLKKVYGKSLS